MSDLQNSIQEHLSALLMDPSSVVKRAVLHNISSLCIFLGRQKTNDVLLSHMITYLNDRDWLLRWAFFDSIVDVAACADGRSLEEYILPLMIQSLSGRVLLLGSGGVKACLLGSLDRCRGDCGREGAFVSHKPMRARPVPKDAYLGTDERNPRLPLSPKYLDSGRCVAGRRLHVLGGMLISV